MKAAFVTYLVAIGLFACSGAQASEALAKSKNCMACHAIQKKNVGPSYKDIAAKYAGKKGAEAQLTEKVLKGGKGSWGEVPMPPNSGMVKPDEAQKLVKWILSQQ